MKKVITIVGLGPGGSAQLTLEAWSLLQKAKEIYLRTLHHPVVASFPKKLILYSFDHIYEEKKTFAEVYEEIARRVIELGKREEGVIYAVPGHPLVGEASTQHILALASEEGIEVHIVGGLSFIEPVLTCLGLDALEGLQIVDAMELAARFHPNLNPDMPTLVAQLYGRSLASEVKLTLTNLFPDDHPVTLVRAAGTPEETLRTLPLCELDRGEEFDHLTTLYIPPLPSPGSLESFQDTIARLRSEEGCPWDREQTHRSLRHTLLEEAYEALAAIDADDMDALREELGDLLLQIVLQAQIAVEEGDFSLAQVIAEIDSKIKRRHPHVFGETKVKGVEEVLHRWEEIKKGEKGKWTLSEVLRSLPALARAHALQERAARVGFDWPDEGSVVAEITEGLAELRNVRGGREREEKFGDLLFSLVNLARCLKVDAESALRAACERFSHRFSSR